MKQKVNILGTEYTILLGTVKDFPELKSVDGYTDTSEHQIVVDDMTMEQGQVGSKKDLKSYQHSVIRHEIFHAFLYESGIAENSNSVESWGINEEMVDWFAIQSPKIFRVFQELNVL